MCLRASTSRASEGVLLPGKGDARGSRLGKIALVLSSEDCVGEVSVHVPFLGKPTPFFTGSGCRLASAAEDRFFAWELMKQKSKSATRARVADAHRSVCTI